MKYTIIHVNDRAKLQIDNNRKLLRDFEYVEAIDFINGNIIDAKRILSNKSIKTDVWNPYDGRLSPPLPGEYGIWASLINVWEYIVKNNVETMLVLEDDIELDKDCKKNILKCVKELPEQWDFLSLFYFEDQNMITEDSDLGLKLIHKSINQLSGGTGMIYSKSGVEKILKLVKRLGIQYTSDCFIFHQARQGFLNGYSLIPNSIKIIKHTFEKTGSVIDPENLRDVQL